MHSQKKHIVILVFLLTIQALKAQTGAMIGSRNLPGTSKIFSAENDIFGTRNFIENKGQFANPIRSLENVLFVYEYGGEKIFFTSRGLIYDQIKRPKPNKEREKEEEHNGNPEHFYVQMNWLDANKDIEVEKSERQSHYFTYGTAEQNAYGYKKITYKNVYDNIDIEYTIPADKKSGIKYNVVLHPGADPGKVQITYTGNVKKISKNRRGEIVITTAIDKIIEHAPKSFYSDNTPIEMNFELSAQGGSAFGGKKGIIGFVFPGGYDTGRTVIIDPWVTGIQSLTNSNTAFDVDYDFAGNTYIYGGPSPFWVAKYNTSGAMQWIFSGTLLTPAWTNTGSAGNFAVDRTNGKCYTGQGWINTGARVVRLNSSGNYDNYISVANGSYLEIWDMGFHCQSNNLFTFGGSVTSTMSAATMNTSSGTITVSNFQPGITSPSQDVVSYAMDDLGRVFVVFASIPNPISNHLCLVNTGFNGNDWTQPTGFTNLMENANKTFYQPTSAYVQSNGFNCLAVNDNFLFYYDGLNLAAYSKLTGVNIATITVPGVTLLRQGGIAVDDCNNVYLGGSGSILTYNFNGSGFNALASIPLAAQTPFPNVHDLKLDRNNSLLYVCGSGFVGIYKAQLAADCGIIGDFSVAVTPTMVCPGESATLTAVGALTYSWSTGGTASSETVFPNGTTTYSVVGTGTSVCGNFTATIVKTVSLGTMPPPKVTGAKLICNGATTTLVANGAATYTWNVGTPTLIVSPSVAVSPGVNTIYTVMATNNLNTCSSKSMVAVSVSNCVSVVEIPPEAQLVNIYPNPVKDKLFVEVLDPLLKSFDVTIYNALGQVLYSAEKLNLQQVTIHTVEVGTFPKGIYLVSIQSGEQKQTFRLVRE